MSDHVPPSVAEVWNWKRGLEEECEVLPREELIERMKKIADDFEKRLNLDLPSKLANYPTDSVG